MRGEEAEQGEGSGASPKTYRKAWHKLQGDVRLEAQGLLAICFLDWICLTMAGPLVWDTVEISNRVTPAFPPVADFPPCGGAETKPTGRQ